MSSPRARVLVVTMVIMTIGGISSGVATATTRGQGTMLVRQSQNCSGTGDASSVSVPFSVLFTGFAPNATGTVTAFTQPGGVQVGTRRVTVGPDGERCVRVTGDVPTGQYKIVYDFGSGTGKQKVIRITGSAPQPTVTPTAPTVAPTAPTVTPTATPPASASASPSTDVGHLKFTQLPKTQVAPERQSLPRTGGLSVAALTLIGSVLLGLGVLLARTSPRFRRGNRKPT